MLLTQSYWYVFPLGSKNAQYCNFIRLVPFFPFFLHVQWYKMPTVSAWLLWVANSDLHRRRRRRCPIRTTYFISLVGSSGFLLVLPRLQFLFWSLLDCCFKPVAIHYQEPLKLLFGNLRIVIPPRVLHRGSGRTVMKWNITQPLPRRPQWRLNLEVGGREARRAVRSVNV